MCTNRIAVGIKKFTFMVEMARQMEKPSEALEQLVALMEQEGCFYAPSTSAL